MCKTQAKKFKHTTWIIIAVSLMVHNSDQFNVERVGEQTQGGEVPYGFKYFNSNPEEMVFTPRILNIPNTSYYESFIAGYPFQRMAQLVLEYRLPKEFFVKESFELEPNIRDVGEEEVPCKSVTRIIYPTIALNKLNQWRFIFNDPKQKEYSQSVLIELCGGKPNEPCSVVGEELPYITSCKQKFMFRRLIALNEKGKPEIDIFKLPSACVCTFKKKQYNRIVLDKRVNWLPQRIVNPKTQGAFMLFVPS